MGTSILQDCKLYLAQFNLSGMTNTLSLTREIDEVPAAVFGNTCRWSMPGLERISFEHEGLFGSDGTDEPDDAIAAKLAVASVPMMVCPLTGAINEAAYFAPVMAPKYTPFGGAVGEMAAFKVSGSGQGQGLILGRVMATGSKTATASSTPYELGAVTAAANYLYAQLHVFSVSGTNPTLTVIVESDDAQAFTTPVTRVTFTQATTVTAQWATPVAGAITDTWWRVTYTIGGTNTPTFNFAVAVGIR